MKKPLVRRRKSGMAISDYHQNLNVTIQKSKDNVGGVVI
tara:strand:+ start:1183 stop:1299 length:117 start_codon:yes stop_codon:yes gene_type:complete